MNNEEAKKPQPRESEQVSTLLSLPWRWHVCSWRRL